MLLIVIVLSFLQTFFILNFMSSQLLLLLQLAFVIVLIKTIIFEIVEFIVRKLAQSDL